MRVTWRPKHVRHCRPYGWHRKARIAWLGPFRFTY